ncbi:MULTISPECIES: hypothetical protein [unclassified Microbulbifer]|uniref:hypothetical protein n=1 Tax=unclassified Microbulbifer TaxID=2619833 RepID=UPI001E3EEF18|nr:hypothetical protein [Microbulbifer sp. YPW16]UHQ56878.1 hypothetical protein LVE68_07855 [Microbulbifer sp. YPW16]
MQLVKLTFLMLSLLLSVDKSNAAEGGYPFVGVYSNMFIHEKTQDVLGVEIMIMLSGQDYYVVFQSASGVARPPIVVKASIKKNILRFTVEDRFGYSGTFEGEILEGGIKGGFLEGQLIEGNKKKALIKRKESFWNLTDYWKSREIRNAGQ